MLSVCGGALPLWLCGYGDLLLYLLPSAVLAWVFARLARLHPLFFVFTLAGTVCHELAHLIVGAITGAKPVSLSLIPRKIRSEQGATQWRLGSVSFTRLRWYNAAPAALAPFLVLAVPLAVAVWRTDGDWHFVPMDLLIAVLLAPQWLSFWPSRADWRLAARSWPLLLLWLLAVAAWLFQLVKH